MITNPGVFDPNFKPNLHDAFLFGHKYFFGIAAGVAASVFKAFNFIAVRRIGKQIHSSIKTMYLGLVAVIISSLILLYYNPSYFKLWSRKEYLTSHQLLLVLVLACLFYVFQESLSTALENLKAGTVATFSYISVVIYHFGF